MMRVTTVPPCALVMLVLEEEGVGGLLPARDAGDILGASAFLLATAAAATPLLALPTAATGLLSTGCPRMNLALFLPYAA